MAKLFTWALLWCHHVVQCIRYCLFVLEASCLRIQYGTKVLLITGNINRMEFFLNREAATFCDKISCAHSPKRKFVTIDG